MKFSAAAVSNMAYDLAVRLVDIYGQVLKVYGVPRGGVPVAMAMAAHPAVTVVDRPEEATVVVDDVIDSGSTRARFAAKPFAALIGKGGEEKTPQTFVGSEVSPGEWVTFPWEGDELHSADDIPRRLLQFIGEDPARGGLVETPHRFLKAWRHYTSGYQQDPAKVLKTFEDGAERYDEMVLVRDIPVYSHCEHHLAPFFGVAHVAYIPNGKIVGLSKLSRLVEVFARRLQVQERLTNQIADAIEDALQPKGVAVVINCRHMCMEARGIQRQGSSTVTSAMRGAFMSKPEARAEFMGLIGG